MSCFVSTSHTCKSCSLPPTAAKRGRDGKEEEEEEAEEAEEVEEEGVFASESRIRCTGLPTVKHSCSHRERESTPSVGSSKGDAVRSVRTCQVEREYVEATRLRASEQTPTILQPVHPAHDTR